MVGEAGILPVGLGILQVYLLVGHIQVAAQDDGLLGIQCHQVGTEVVLPLHAVVQSLQPVLRIGSVAGDQIEVVRLQRDDAAFVVVLVDADSVCNAQRLMLGEYGRTRIALLVGIVPVRLVAVEREVQLSLLHLCLLQTEKVSVHLLEDVAEPFPFTGSQPVDVP